jgi:hypothetical protein
MLGSVALPVSAAPVVGSDLKATAIGGNSVEQAHYYRRCWHRYGRLVCPRVVRRYYWSYAYSPYYDDGTATATATVPVSASTSEVAVCVVVTSVIIPLVKKNGPAAHRPLLFASQP